MESNKQVQQDNVGGWYCGVGWGWGTGCNDQQKHDMKDSRYDMGVRDTLTTNTKPDLEKHALLLTKSATIFPLVDAYRPFLNTDITFFKQIKVNEIISHNRNFSRCLLPPLGEWHGPVPGQSSLARDWRRW